MARQIIPQRLIISANQDGTMKDAVLMYRINTNGALSGSLSVGVKNSLTGEQISSAILAAAASAKESEGIQ